MSLNFITYRFIHDSFHLQVELPRNLLCVLHIASLSPSCTRHSSGTGGSCILDVGTPPKKRIPCMQTEHPSKANRESGQKSETLTFSAVSFYLRYIPYNSTVLGNMGYIPHDKSQIRVHYPYKKR